MSTIQTHTTKAQTDKRHQHTQQTTISQYNTKCTTTKQKIKNIKHNITQHQSTSKTQIGILSS
jgi:hypothetical protein